MLLSKWISKTVFSGKKQTHKTLV